MQLNKLIDWLRKQKKTNKLKINKKNISNLKDWIFKKNQFIIEQIIFFLLNLFYLNKATKDGSSH